MGYMFTFALWPTEKGILLNVHDLYRLKVLKFYYLLNPSQFTSAVPILLSLIYQLVTVPMDSEITHIKFLESIMNLLAYNLPKIINSSSWIRLMLIYFMVIYYI